LLLLSSLTSVIFTVLELGILHLPVCIQCPLEAKGRGFRGAGKAEYERKHTLHPNYNHYFHFNAVLKVSYLRSVLVTYLTSAVLTLVLLPPPRVVAKEQF
jgi:hypothetical protein